MSVLQQYKNLDKIGSSNNSVIYNADGKEALKVLIHNKEHKHTQQCYHLKNEASMLQKCNHSNIIKPRQYATSQVHEGQKFCSLSVELADMDFFGLIEKTFPNKIDGNSMIQLLKQVCDGIQYLHKKNICHNDLKLENIFIFLNEEKEGQIGAKAKIADFGFARNCEQEIDSKKLYEKWNNRSNCSLAPEILDFKKMCKSGKFQKAVKFDEKKSDMFALGIMIFSAFFLRSPIKSETAQEKDEYFQYFYNNEFEQFWNLKDFQYEMKRTKNDLGEEGIKNLKNLIQGLLEVNSNKRLNIEQVLAHKIFN